MSKDSHSPHSPDDIKAAQHRVAQALASVAQKKAAADAAAQAAEKAHLEAQHAEAHALGGSIQDDIALMVTKGSTWRIAGKEYVFRKTSLGPGIKGSGPYRAYAVKPIKVNEAS